MTAVELSATLQAGERSPLAIPHCGGKLYRSLSATPHKTTFCCTSTRTAVLVQKQLEFMRTHPSVSHIFSEVDVSVEKVSQPQAHDKEADRSKYSPASLSNPRHWVRTASAVAISPVYPSPRGEVSTHTEKYTKHTKKRMETRNVVRDVPGTAQQQRRVAGVTPPRSRDSVLCERG